MPDWHKLVRDRLSHLELDATEREEVCAELAAHLEDYYDNSTMAGASEEIAMDRALRQVTNWQELKARIESARTKELSMNKRVLQFWLPACITILLTMTTLMVIQILGPQPSIVDPLAVRANRWRTIAPVAVVYVPWLLTLPFIGASGAYVSARGGASRITMLSAIVFPVLPYFAFFLVRLPIAVIL